LFFLKILLILTLLTLIKNFPAVLNVSYNLSANVKYLLIKNLAFLPMYYKRNELLWVDGFIIDFLQKKSIDIFIRKFIIYTGFIFSERLVFDHVVRLYLDNVIWPLHYFSMFEFNNIREILSIILFFYFNIFILTFLFFIILL
jgi:hypothetical protein